MLIVTCSSCHTSKTVIIPTFIPTPTATSTTMPTPTATPTPSPTPTETPSYSEDIVGDCYGDDCHMSFGDLGSSMTIKCGTCWEKDTFIYTGEFIYEDEPDRGYHNLRNPSYDELMNFLASDKTDEVPYSVPDFMCHHYSVTLRENANQQGLRCACVNVYYVPADTRKGVNYEHTVVAFDTSDMGLVHIEPQDDTQLALNEQWQTWPCHIIDGRNMCDNGYAPTNFMLYCLVYIW